MFVSELLLAGSLLTFQGPRVIQVGRPPSPCPPTPALAASSACLGCLECSCPPSTLHVRPALLGLCSVCPPPPIHRPCGLQMAKHIATAPSLGAKGPGMRERLLDLLVICLLYIPM